MLKELTISPEALKDGDVTLLEDLILTAVGEAQRASEAHMQESHGQAHRRPRPALLAPAPPTCTRPSTSNS